MTPRVLLADTSRWALPTRLAIAFARAGVDVSAIFPLHQHPLLKTSAVRQAFSYSGFRPLESLAAAIKTAKPQVIIPCDDWAVQHLHELYARERALGTSGSETADLIERSLGRPESHAVTSARYGLLEMAHDEGIRVPDMTVLRTMEDLEYWGAKQAFPWVLKADGTCGGRGVKIAHSPEQAQRFFLKLTQSYGTARVIKRLIVNHDPFWLRPWWNRVKPHVMVQSYIHGQPANCAVVCWEGKVLAGIGVRVVVADGLTGPASVVRVVDNAEMMTAAERIARRLGLSGFFGLDFMIEESSGRIYLIEMNARCTPLCHLELGKGRDMIAALSAQLSGRPVLDTPAVTENDLIAYFPQAWTTTVPSEMLASSFQDVPDEPELVQELLRPWPDRSLLFRIVNYLSRTETMGPQTGGFAATAAAVAAREVLCNGRPERPL
jgi:hypothetical protein